MEVLELMSSNKHVNSVLFKNYTGLAHSRSFSQPLTSSRHSNGPSTAFDSVSPTVDENGLVRTKSRRVRDEEAFLAWLKHDPGLQHSKNVQMMMVRHEIHCKTKTNDQGNEFIYFWVSPSSKIAIRQLT